MATTCTRFTVSLYLTALSSVALASHTPTIPKQDRAWKRYDNARWGYCVNYPSRWVKGDAYDGGGLFVKSGLRNSSKPLGAIDIGVLQVQKQGVAHAEPVSLVENFQVHLDGMKRFERAERMEVLETRNTELAGSPALYAKDRYYDPLDRASWIDEIFFVSRNDALYRLELSSRADQLDRFDSVFSRLVSTFRFDCATMPQ